MKVKIILKKFITVSSVAAQNSYECYPARHVETRNKLNVHKTFRRRPGRYLNALCTFHLRLVSTGPSVDILSDSQDTRLKL